MRTVVLGSQGQLGRDLTPRLRGEVYPLTRTAGGDLTRPDLLGETLRELHPTLVVNCAAYNFVDRAESEPEACFAVNTWGVRELARLCRDLDCVLVHFSTDHVFGLDALRRTPWTESDTPGPVNVYGLSKLSGEYFVRSICSKHLVIRTCGLYGLHGSGGKGGNFVETMLKVASQNKPLRVVYDQCCTPTFTEDLAATTVALVNSGATGLYHVTNSGACTWYEFAQTIFEMAGLKADIKPISSDNYSAAARRPAYSVLESTALRSAGLEPMRPWRKALAAYLQARVEKQ